jgi:hypothetical protein
MGLSKLYACFTQHFAQSRQRRFQRLTHIRVCRDKVCG